jgi:hypothetical protein
MTNERFFAIHASPIRHSRVGGNPSYCHCERSEAIQKNIRNFFCFAKSKDLATVFLDQARKKQRTCHAGCIVLINILGCPRIFILLGRCGTQLLLFATTTSNKSSRFILAKSKIHRRHKCVGLKINIYYITKTLRVLVMRRETSGLLRFARNDGKDYNDFVYSYVTCPLTSIF